MDQRRARRKSYCYCCCYCYCYTATCDVPVVRVRGIKWYMTYIFIVHSTGHFIYIHGSWMACSKDNANSNRLIGVLVLVRVSLIFGLLPLSFVAADVLLKNPIEQR